MLKLTAVFLLGIALGAAFTRIGDVQTVRQAQQNETQANGLEDECKQTLRQKTGFISEIPTTGWTVETVSQ